jgi:hypothetical protein
MDGRSGLGVYGARARVSQALGRGMTVFQSEILVIECCARRLLDRRLRKGRIIILSDS